MYCRICEKYNHTAAQCYKNLKNAKRGTGIGDGGKERRKTGGKVGDVECVTALGEDRMEAVCSSNEFDNHFR